MTVADHKRKSRPIAPATVTVDADSITVVVPDVLGKNEALAVQDRKGHRHLSMTAKRYREAVRLGVEAHCLAVHRQPQGYGFHDLVFAQAFKGAFRLEVLAVWPRERHTIKGRPVDFGVCPMGDADAAIPQALDALQHAGILDDDARVVEVRAWSLYRKGQRATIIRLVRVPDLAERDAAIAHLAEHVPADSPPTAKKSRRKAAAP